MHGGLFYRALMLAVAAVIVPMAVQVHLKGRDRITARGSSPDRDFASTPSVIGSTDSTSHSAPHLVCSKCTRQFSRGSGLARHILSCRTDETSGDDTDSRDGTKFTHETADDGDDEGDAEMSPPQGPHAAAEQTSSGKTGKYKDWSGRNARMTEGRRSRQGELTH